MLMEELLAKLGLQSLQRVFEGLLFLRFTHIHSLHSCTTSLSGIRFWRPMASNMAAKFVLAV